MRKSAALVLVLTAAFIAAGLAGCAGITKRGNQEKSREAEEVDTYVQAPRESGKELKPVDEPAPAEAEEEPAPEPEPETQISAVPEEEVELPVPPAPPESASIEIDHVPGYRVQIFATRDPEGARTFAESARGVFREKMYVEYLEPYYKVRVGDCRTREEADILLEEARAAGFDEAWIAATLVIQVTERLR